MKNSIVRYYIISIAAALLFIGCSQVKHYDDAVRIKPEMSAKYLKHPFSDSIRDGRTLRGSVLGVKVLAKPDSCPITENTEMIVKRYVVFLDSLSKSNSEAELIPLEDLELIGQMTDVPMNEAGNINLFENFNNPFGIRNLREVPVDSIFSGCSPCGCEDVEFGMDYKFNLTIECIKRVFPWYFLELKGGYSIYNDKLNVLEETGRSGFSGEFAAGFRLGEFRQYGIGLTYTTGINILNSFNGEDFTRPAVLLYGRWQSTSDRFFGMCMRPFLYGQFGVTIDDLSLDLMKVNFCDECELDPSIEELPEVDLSLPLSYGFGVGMDIPVLPIMDLSFDVGYRTLGFGESLDILGYLGVPTQRRIHMLMFRFGLTF